MQGNRHGEYKFINNTNIYTPLGMCVCVWQGYATCGVLNTILKYMCCGSFGVGKYQTLHSCTTGTCCCCGCKAPSVNVVARPNMCCTIYWHLLCTTNSCSSAASTFISNNNTNEQTHKHTCDFMRFSTAPTLFRHLCFYFYFFVADLVSFKIKLYSAASSFL